MLSGEATNTNFIVIGLTRSGLEPTIYRAGGEHANHYTTDAREKRGLGHTKIITTTVQTLRSNNIQVQKGSDNMIYHNNREHDRTSGLLSR